MGLLDKISSKTSRKVTDRVADKVSTGIVNKLFGKSSSEDTATSSGATVSVSVDQASADAMSKQMTENAQELMGMVYNTKKCPNCKSICFNSPLKCKYCEADLRDVEPLSPEEMEKMGI